MYPATLVLSHTAVVAHVSVHGLNRFEQDLNDVLAGLKVQTSANRRSKKRDSGSESQLVRLPDSGASEPLVAPATPRPEVALGKGPRTTFRDVLPLASSGLFDFGQLGLTEA